MRTAAMDDTAYRAPIQSQAFAMDQAFITALYAFHRQALIDGIPSHAADGSIHAGRIAAAC